MDCDAKQRADFLISLEKEAKAFNEPLTKENEGKKDEDKKPLHYYSMMKQLTVVWFFHFKNGCYGNFAPYTGAR